MPDFLKTPQVLHFIQLHSSGHCQLFDYGSAAANAAAYNSITPPDIAAAYSTLCGVPVHLVAGRYDGVIPAPNIRRHYEAMTAAGVDVSYREVWGMGGAGHTLWHVPTCHPSFTQPISLPCNLTLFKIQN